MINPFRVWCIAVGIAHLAVLGGMFSQFHDEFISEQLDTFPLFKLFMSTVVICEILSAIFYVVAVQSESFFAILVVFLAAIIALVGWTVICVFVWTSRAHLEAVPIFCAGTAAYTLSMLVIGSLHIRTTWVRYTFISLFVLFYAVTATLVIFFLVLVSRNQDKMAILFEWGAYISLGINYTLFFAITPYVPKGIQNENTSQFIPLHEIKPRQTQAT